MSAATSGGQRFGFPTDPGFSFAYPSYDCYDFFARCALSA